MSPLGVVPDFITSFHPNPLRNGAVLLLLFGQEPLYSEGLVRRHGEGESGTPTTMAEERRKEKNLF